MVLLINGNTRFFFSLSGRYIAAPVIGEESSIRDFTHFTVNTSISIQSRICSKHSSNAANAAWESTGGISFPKSMHINYLSNVPLLLVTLVLEETDTYK